MTNPNADALLQQAQALIKAGRRNDARPLLESLVNQDDQNEMGWLFLSACVDSLNEQKICLENVLMLNPANQKAQKGLEVVKQKLAANAPKPPPQQSQQTAAPAPSAYDFGSPYDSGVVNMGSGTYSAPSDADMWSGNEQSYEAPTASSVDWGKGSAPAYGSGQNVPQPSAKEFDSWVAKLPLGGKAKEPDLPQPRSPQTMRTTADVPPLDVEATEEQFNIPSAYDRDDDPFRASFDFTDGTGFAAATPAAAPKSVSPFDMADFGGDVGAASFDFTGDADFGGPFSASSGSSAVNAPAEPNYGYSPNPPATTDSNMFKFDTGSFAGHSQSQPQDQGYADSYEQNYEQSGSSFRVPGGYSDPTASDSNSFPAAGRGGSSGSGTSADRFKFGAAPLETGSSASKGSRRGVELPGSSGLFRDNPLDSRPDLADTITEFSDDDLGGASGVFGMATRKGDSRAKRPEGFPPANSPMISSSVTSSGAFRLIPAEIKVAGGRRSAAGGGKVSVRTLIAVVLLLILNILSIATLIFFNLRGMGIV